MQFLQQNWRLYQHRPVEIIIIDNGSTDSTPIMLETWTERGVQVITNEDNQGFGPANNQGAKEASGDVLIFINNDVVVKGDYVTILIEALKRNPRDLYGAQYLDFDTGWNTFADGVKIPYLAGWCLAMRRRTFDKLGGFDERYKPGDFEDVDLCYTASRDGRFLRPVQLPVTHMFGQTARQLPDRKKVTEKHRELFAEKWRLPL